MMPPTPTSGVSSWCPLCGDRETPDVEDPTCRDCRSLYPEFVSRADSLRSKETTTGILGMPLTLAAMAAVAAVLGAAALFFAVQSL